MVGVSFIATLAVRFFQILFAIIVLGLSVTMAKWQFFGKPPATTEYGAFSGGFAFLVGIIGAAAIFISAIPPIIVAGADALAAVLTLAAGIVSYPLSLPPGCQIFCLPKKEELLLTGDFSTGLRSHDERRPL